MNVSQRGEFGLIAHLQQNLTRRAGVKLGIGDDGAVLDALQYPVVTTDALVENVHFRRDWTSAQALGRKAMAVNLSDLAAMGARPVAAFVSLALPPDCDLEWVTQLYAGMETMAEQYDFTLAGGDTTGAPLVLIAVTLLGDLISETPVLRSGARVGDALCVTGNLGDSAAGLALLQSAVEVDEVDEAARAFLMGRHLEPTPRLNEMRALLKTDRDAIHAALDISDGLVGDAAHMARASGVAIEIDAEKLPIADACRAAARALNQSPLDWALSGGEDYELCLSLAPDAAQRLEGVTIIGRVVEGAGEVRVIENGKPRDVGASWTHF